MSKIRIAVDAGHGSNTLGKRTPPLPQDVDFNDDGVIDVAKGDRIREHIANMNVALFLTEELIRCGFSVIVTGFDDENALDDEDTSLANRQKLIKKGECDYSVSIHFNAYGDGDGEGFNSAQGVGVYIHNTYPKDSKALAAKVLSYLIGGMSQTNRGISSAGLAMCNCNAMNTKASILIECAFMTNLHEAIHMVGNEEYWKETAVEIAKGICDYTSIAYVEAESLSPATDKILYRVQVGAFRSKKNADSYLQKVVGSGFSDAFVKVTTMEGKSLYRIQIGAYAIKANAEKMLFDIKAAGFTDAFIRK